MLQLLQSSPTLSAADAAELLGIGRSTVYAAAKAGAVPSVRVGNRVRILSRWVLFDTCSQIECQHGRDYLIAMNAAVALVSVRQTDWGMPRWPAVVETFVNDLDSAPPVNIEDLRRGLLTAPDMLGGKVLQWCIDKGIGFTRT
ncbi:helix-turn-helix domain-containing protein [Nocardia amikacinitolerans]|uniref:helix-turn-helix domain-containing protein n=1 Tax=Nocardia amikacinitolerans TaxID=756689 RepID=UPI0020A49D72|nr:helix-turn-helix domain-containing protein [Nocardia amikacinitolerans]